MTTRKPTMPPPPRQAPASETNIWKRVLLAAGRLPGVRLFRNNVGQGWIGHAVRLPDGAVLIENARPLHAGLFVGSGDGIGWHSITITPEMVGRRVAVFLSVETKTARGRASAEQNNWREQVAAAGGIALIVRSDAEFTDLLQNYSP